jgi:hypothetical protein
MSIILASLDDHFVKQWIQWWSFGTLQWSSSPSKSDYRRRLVSKKKFSSPRWVWTIGKTVRRRTPYHSANCPVGLKSLAIHLQSINCKLASHNDQQSSAMMAMLTITQPLQFPCGILAYPFPIVSGAYKHTRQPDQASWTIDKMCWAYLLQCLSSSCMIVGCTKLRWML